MGHAWDGQWNEERVRGDCKGEMGYDVSVTILVLVAGTNEPSNANVLADAFIEGTQSVEGIAVKKLRVKDLTIEHFTLERYSPQCILEDDFCMLQEAILGASGIVIATPIWNFSVPAHLKNLIDRIGAFALDEATRSRGMLGGKPFYLIFTGGAPLPAWKTIMRFTTMHVAEAIKYYAGTIIGIHFEGRCMAGKGVFGVVVGSRPRTLDSLRRQGMTFAKVVKTFTESGKLPLGKRLSLKFHEFGQRLAARL